MANWQCKAKKSWPLSADRAWDGSAAEQRLFDHFGFDGDTPNPDVDACFLAVDTDAPGLQSSYKLPFCDLVDGEIHAIPQAVRAAASRLPQTDIPDNVKEDARKVVDAYEAKFVDAAAEAESLIDHPDGPFRASAAFAAGTVTWGEVVGDGPIPFTIDALAIDVPSPAPPGGQTGKPKKYVFPADVVARDHVTFRDQPVRIARTMDSHDQIRGGRMEPAPVRGVTSNTRIVKRGSVRKLVIDGVVWPNECDDRLLAYLRDPSNEIGASVEWFHDDVERDGMLVCQKFCGIGVAILDQDAAAWRNHTSFALAASAAQTDEEETGMKKLPLAAEAEALVDPEMAPEDFNGEACKAEMVTDSGGMTAEMVTDSGGMMAEDAVPQDSEPSEDPDLPAVPPAKAEGDDLMARLDRIEAVLAQLASMGGHEDREEAIKDTAEELLLNEGLEDLVEDEMEEHAEPDGDEGLPGPGDMDEDNAPVEAEAACKGEGMSVPMKAAAGLPITPAELDEYTRELRAAAALEDAPDGRQVAHVSLRASGDEEDPVARPTTLLDEGYRLAREKGLTGMRYTQFAWDYANGGEANR